MFAKDKNENRDYFVLRLVARPYMLYPILIVFLVVISLPYIIRTHDYGMLAGPILVLFFSVIIVYFGTRYRVWWRNGNIVMRSADKIFVIISVEDIKSIKQETSDLHNVVKMRRPVRRISIYSNTLDGDKFIDISLKHFNLEDIRKLINLIHERRPDLEMPEGWI